MIQLLLLIAEKATSTLILEGWLVGCNREHLAIFNTIHINGPE
jgi:hypothetical protein